MAATPPNRTLRQTQYESRPFGRKKTAAVRRREFPAHGEKRNDEVARIEQMGRQAAFSIGGSTPRRRGAVRTGRRVPLTERDDEVRRPSKKFLTNDLWSPWGDVDSVSV